MLHFFQVAHVHRRGALLLSRSKGVLRLWVMAAKSTVILRVVGACVRVSGACYNQTGLCRVCVLPNPFPSLVTRLEHRRTW